MIFPTGQTATQKEDYFSAFVQHIKKYYVTHSIILYPKTFSNVTKIAAPLTRSSMVIPIPIDNPFYGNKEFLCVIRYVLSTIIRASPSNIHIVTSGGTAKMVQLAHITGATAEKVGLDVDYLWAAKNGKNVYELTFSPKIKIIAGAELDVSLLDNGAVEVSYPLEGGQSKELIYEKDTNK